MRHSKKLESPEFTTTFVCKSFWFLLPFPGDPSHMEEKFEDTKDVSVSKKLISFSRFGWRWLGRSWMASYWSGMVESCLTRWFSTWFMDVTTTVDLSSLAWSGMPVPRSSLWSFVGGWLSSWAGRGWSDDSGRAGKSSGREFSWDLRISWTILMWSGRTEINNFRNFKISYLIHCIFASGLYFFTTDNLQINGIQLINLIRNIKKYLWQSAF